MPRTHAWGAGLVVLGLITALPGAVATAEPTSGGNLAAKPSRPDPPPSGPASPATRQPAIASVKAGTAPPTPFSECPAIGADPSCGTLIVVNPDRSVDVFSNNSVGPYDGGDDTLIGIQNNSAQPVPAITAFGPGGLFAFDGDGLCTFSGAPPSCSSAVTGYEGPGTSFITDPANSADGEIDFAGMGLAPHSATYFSLEGAVNAASLVVHLGHLSQFTITPTFGTLFSGSISLLPPGGAGPVTNETATVAWGDGSVSPATLSVAPGDPNTLHVAASHTYWIPGRVTVAVTVTNTQAGAPQTFNGDAVITSRHAGLGDSYSSGEGANWPRLPGCDFPLYVDHSGLLYQGSSSDHLVGAKEQYVPGLNVNGQTCVAPTGAKGDTCHRATTAYSHVVDRLLNLDGLTLDFVACSGAVLHDAFRSVGGNARSGEGPQVSALGSDVSLVTLTFGGNNVDFAGIATECVKDSLLGNNNFDCLKQDDTKLLPNLGYNRDGGYSSLSHTSILPAGGLADNLSFLSSMADRLNLHDALVLLYRDIRHLAPGARILILGYPRFFPNGGSGQSTEHFSNLEQTWVNDRIALLNGVLRDSVTESGVAQYIDVYNAFAGHEEGTGDPNYVVDPSTFAVSCPSNSGNWINPIDVLRGAAGSPENLHPNPCGHFSEGQVTAGAYTAPPTPLDTFSLSQGGTHDTTVVVVSPVANRTRVTVTAQWVAGSPSVTFRDPSGRVIEPTLSGPVSATWTVWHPQGGLWHLTVNDNDTANLGTVNGTVVVSYANIPGLPAEGSIRQTDDSCVFTCNATFQVRLSSADLAQVASFDWFDDQGRQQQSMGNKGDTVMMSSFVNHFRLILRTNGIDGQHRYTVAEIDH
jgi:hypothetical protein